MKHEVIDTTGSAAGSVELDDTVWAVEPNIAVMHQALLMQLANARLGTSDTKTRAEVRGGGRKPWRQKGTGRARQGSIRAPHWAGGGVAFGPHPRDYTQRMPRKMRRLAVRSALSAKVRDERLTVIEGLDAIEPKTKAMITLLAALPEARSYLILLAEKNDGVERAAGNLKNVKTVRAGYANVRDVLKYERLIVSRESIEKIEAILALPEHKREPSVWKQARLAVQAGEAETNG